MSSLIFLYSTHDNISDITIDHSQVLRIVCDAPMTTEQTTEKIETSDAPQSSPQTPVSENSITISSNIDSTSTVTTTTVEHQSITTTTDTTAGKSLVTSALSHDMLKLKIHIYAILNNNFRLEFPKLNT
jgi:formiminotetrahydrofolate cyclodeaminase